MNGVRPQDELERYYCWIGETTILEPGDTIPGFVPVAELVAKERDLKFNPYHDPTTGRFTSRPGGAAGRCWRS